MSMSVVPIALSDINVKPSLKRMIYSSHFKGTAHQQLRKLMKKVNEVGLNIEMLERMGSFDYLLQSGFSHQPDRNAFNQVIPCGERIIKQPEFDLSGITLSNMVTFIIIVSSHAFLLFVFFRWSGYFLTFS